MLRNCRESFKTFHASFLDHSHIRDTLVLRTQFIFHLAGLKKILPVWKCEMGGETGQAEYDCSSYTFKACDCWIIVVRTARGKKCKSIY